ncbi:MAG: fumarylacetoacetate hydrolase [Armatimonadetes bacterium]|nr:fumarylacetoacetate hydrolase [Armatimonadota bacterium]
MRRSISRARSHRSTAFILWWPTPRRKRWLCWRGTSRRRCARACGLIAPRWWNGGRAR